MIKRISLCALFLSLNSYASDGSSPHSYTPKDIRHGVTGASMITAAGYDLAGLSLLSRAYANCQPNKSNVRVIAYSTLGTLAAFVGMGWTRLAIKLHTEQKKNIKNGLLSRICSVEDQDDTDTFTNKIQERLSDMAIEHMLWIR